TTGADARTVTYTTDDQAQIITKGDQRSSFFYGPDKARYKRVDTKISTNASTTTLYIGGVEKIYYPDGVIEWKRNIAGVGQITIKVDANGTEQSRKTHYFHKDHLGSILYISDSTGTIVQDMAYDPWGARRTVSSPTPLSLSTLQSSYFKVAKPVTQRGFTGHEMIDEVGIIHMNGRIYDAKLGRFMQADPIIQDPTSIASLNRYSYCANNPLNATDPSGFSFLSKAWKQLRPFIGVIVAIVMTCVMPAAVGFWAQLAQASLIGAVSGAVGAAANGGNILKGAFYGAFSAAAGVVGGPLGGALAAGAIADREGGSFGRAFLAAAIGGAGGSGSQPSFTGLLQSAVLGGVATRITGGKFKNGAASAAFMYAVQAGVQSASRGSKASNEDDGSLPGIIDLDNSPSEDQIAQIKESTSKNFKENVQFMDKYRVENESGAWQEFDTASQTKAFLKSSAGTGYGIVSGVQRDVSIGWGDAYYSEIKVY
ncbi:MAG TPA: RHS repeat-associated core domain-containing protein, partial [Cellvibrionaceae bacterium]|nr:RHS repeat-associated core domain-containing protein [Cellvibrionaceae bacterium]